MNIETSLVQWFNSNPIDGLHASTDVPSVRPTRFITVERVGGARNSVTDLPLLSVQVWDESRVKASNTAQLIPDALNRFANATRYVGGVHIQSIINNPDPDSGQARYQITVEIVTTL